MNVLARVFPKLFGETPDHTERCAQLTQSSSRSPDLGVLEQYEFQLLFSPDRTQRGCSEYRLIEDSAYICSAFTLKRFNYYQQRDGLPVPLLSVSEKKELYAPSLKIKGELHAIRPYQFKELDNFKDNLVSFRRQRVKLLVPHSPVFQLPERYRNGKPVPLMTGQYSIGSERLAPPIEAWMYIAERPYWEPLLDGGYMFNPVISYDDKRRWLGRYYSLPRETYF